MTVTTNATVRVDGTPSATIEVLLVDDDPRLAESVARLLERENGEIVVRTETSASRGLSRIERDHVDCVVSDYGMPGMDGLGLLERVRERDSDLPFILFTGQGSEQTASEAISRGVTDYVMKGAGTDRCAVLANSIRNAVGRRRIEQERDRRATAMEAAGEGIAILDADRRFLQVNRAYAELYGYDRSKLLGASWELVTPPAETVRMHEEILPVVAAKGSWRGESVGQRADESTFPEAKSIARLEDGGFVCIIRDITEPKARERRLNRQNERLEEFASLVSHDLRNPLGVAQGHLELVSEECNSDHLAPVARAHARMGELIDDLLELARQGEVVREPVPVPLDAAVERAATTTGLDGVRVVDDLPTIEADAERLCALLENLFRNAVEHGSTSNRPPTDDAVEHGSASEQADADGASERARTDVSVRVGSLPDGFYVEDDGTGIPEGKREAIFESGYSTADDGTGFGLSIVRTIADAHGWEVGVTDGETGGARFEITGATVVEN